MSPTPQDEAVARALLAQLRTVFDVHRAVWFGSRAQGVGGQESDWDLLIVAPTDLDPWTRMSVALRATRDSHVARDIFVATPNEYEHMRRLRGSIPWSAERSGKVLAA